MVGRVILIGAVHEALAAYHALVRDESVDLRAVVTVSEEQQASMSGGVDLAQIAQRDGIPVLRFDDVNSAPALDSIRAHEPDLIAVVGWTRLIGNELLVMPPRGCVGFHASLLPRHRGRAPVNWSIIFGETETGNTMMKLNAGVDTGDIVDQRSTPICLDDTCATVYERVAELGAQMLVDNLPPLLAGTAVLTRQDPTVGNLLPKRVPAMGITDWNRPPVDLHNWIRALTKPYPGAFTLLGRRKLHLWGSEPPMEPGQLGAVPGEVLSVDRTSFRVAARGGNVRITEWSWTDGGHEAPPLGSVFAAPPSEVAAWARGFGPRPTSATLGRLM